MLVGIRKATLANYILKKERLNLGIFVSPSSFSQKKLQSPIATTELAPNLYQIHNLLPKT